MPRSSTASVTGDSGVPEYDPFELDVQYDGQKVVGIDPGAHGALALLGLGRGYPLIEAVDMPIRDRGKTVTNNVLDGKALGRILRRWMPTIVVVEDVQPMPARGRIEGDNEQASERHDMPARSAFTFGGFCLGVVTACEAMGFDVLLVRPMIWKRAAGLGKVGDRARSDVKAESLALARTLWPDGPFERVRDEAKAEAALLARFGLGSQMRFF